MNRKADFGRRRWRDATRDRRRLSARIRGAQTLRQRFARRRDDREPMLHVRAAGVERPAHIREIDLGMALQKIRVIVSDST